MKRFDSYINNVLKGKTVTGDLVKLAIARQQKDLKRNDLVWKPEEGIKIVNFIEKYFTHWRGEFDKVPVRLEPWQIFYYVLKYGWFKENGNYRFSRTYKEIARKNGKSALEAWDSLCHAITGPRASMIYCGATTEPQARIIPNFAGRTLLRSPKVINSGYDFFYYKQDIAKVFYKKNDSGILTLTSQADTQDGFFPTMGKVDEYHAHKNDGIYGIMKSGIVGIENSFMDIITTAGWYKHYPCYKLRKMCIDILEGTVEDDGMLALLFALDKGDDWRDKKVWPKANPNLNVSVKMEGLEDNFIEADIQGGSKEVGFRTKNLNEWMDSHTTWISSDKWALCNKNPISIKERVAYAGIQLAATVSANGFTLCMPRDDGGSDFKTWYWMPKRTAMDDDEMKDNYLQWAKEGWLTLTPGNVIDYAFIIQKIIEIRDICSLRTVSFAPQYEAYMMPLLDQGIEMEKVGNSYPNMTGPLRGFEKMVSDQGLNHEGNKMTAYQMGHVAVKEGPDDSVRIDKGNSMGSVAGPVSMLMAYRSFLKGANAEATIEVW